MKKYKPYLNRVDLVKNQVEREELREQEAKRKRSRSIQEQNRQRWLKYQEQLRSELAARYFHSVQSVGGEEAFNTYSVAFDGTDDVVVITIPGSSEPYIDPYQKFYSANDPELSKLEHNPMFPSNVEIKPYEEFWSFPGTK